MTAKERAAALVLKLGVQRTHLDCHRVTLDFLLTEIDRLDKERAALAHRLSMIEGDGK